MTMREADSATALAAVAADWPAGLRAVVATRGMRVRKGGGELFFSPGEACRGFVVVLSGAVRVEHTGEGGRSVVLYRVGPGDTCVMTTACLVEGSAYRAWGYAEGEVEALVLPPAVFQALLAEDPAFRAMAFGVFSRRLGELVEVIDELLLHRVDLRLAEWLAVRAPMAEATHQVVAAELGTAREVVSRILKEFERRGWIGLGRGSIRVLEPEALRRFSATS
jgi:CRP/FNR family transcriptional regulator, anaerobic regulatory protein